MAAMNDERVDTIFLLADGLPGGGKITDPGRIRAEIARINTTRKIRIHGISIGRPSALLRDLAADTGGQYREES